MESKDIELDLRQLVSEIQTNINSYTGLAEMDPFVDSLFIETFNKLYEKSVEENYFWEYCSFITYKETFLKRFDNHKINFPDDDLDDFIGNELSELQNSFYYQEEFREPYEHEILRYEYSCFTFSFDNTPLPITISLDILDNYNNLNYKLEKAHTKKIKFLHDMKLTNSTNIDENKKSDIKFTGTPTEFVELVKALIVNKSIEGESQKEIYKSLSKFLNIEINLPDKLLQDIKKRNNDSETLFLDKLKKNFYAYLNQKK